MKRQTIKNMIGSICFIVVFAVALGRVSNLLERKNSRIGYEEFWENPEGYDVWLLGTSHMRQGVHVVEMYQDYKITSYCLASTSNPIPQTYWTFLNALAYAEPKVVVLDCFHVVKDGKMPQKPMNMHNGMDSIPFSRMKIRMVNDLFEDREKRIEHLFDFYVYHNRWDQLGAGDLSPRRSLLKGGTISSKIKDMSAYRVVDETDMCEPDSTGFVYLRRIIEECQKRDIPLVLTAMPCCIDEEQRGMNAVGKVAAGYGVPFLNMIYDERFSIDFQTDFHDEGHLNWGGAQKTTQYIGKYLLERFPGLVEGRKEETDREWEAHCRLYKKEKIRWLKGEKSLDRFLIRLHDDDFSCQLYRREGTGDADETLEKLLAQIPGLHPLSYVKAVSAVGDCSKADFVAVVKDKDSEKIVDTAVFRDGKRTHPRASH